MNGAGWSSWARPITDLALLSVLPLYSRIASAFPLPSFLSVLWVRAAGSTPISIWHCSNDLVQYCVNNALKRIQKKTLPEDCAEIRKHTGLTCPYTSLKVDLQGHNCSSQTLNPSNSLSPNPTQTKHSSLRCCYAQFR